MSDPKIFVLFFIAFIGLVYILSTCQWKSPSKVKDDSHHTEGNHGNSTSNFPAVAKALATSDQSTTSSDLTGEAMTLQCPTPTNTIKTITSALFKCGDASNPEDIKAKINPRCINHTACTVQTSWDNHDVWLHVAPSDTLPANHHKEIIRDPYHGCPKHLDISFSCESAYAGSIFISTNSESTINCHGQKIQIESAWYRKMHKVDQGINVLDIPPTQDGITNLLDTCNGKHNCKIKPTDSTDTGTQKTYFAIDDNVCSYRSDCGFCDSTNTKCPGVDNATPNEPKELAIVYYCSD